MIRQAHTYLVGAVGGATLIALAIAVFVLLVSAQVFRDWPIAALGGGGSEGAEVSGAQPLGAVGGDAGAEASPERSDRGAADGGDDGQARRAGSDRPATDGLAPVASGPAGTPGGSGGENDAGGSPQAATTPSTGAGGGAGGGSSSGGGAGGGGAPVRSPSSQVAGTVNDTVNQVDEAAVGGALGDSGVTEATEGVVNGAAGPESAVGQAVDGAAGAVGGVVGGTP